MKMMILSMEYSNIRKFSSLKVDFCNEHGFPHKNTFIMMGNGTGKTTTITLIKGLLDGSAAAWNAETVRSFAPSKGTASTGSFKLSVKFDEAIYIYVLSFDYNAGKAVIGCTTSSQGGLGPRKFPKALENLFTQEFVRRFVFDGEQATKAMDTNSNEADDAIKYLYRLDVFDAIARNNQYILSAIQDAEGGARGTSQSVTNLRSRQNKIKDYISRLETNHKRLRNDVDELQKQQSELETQIAQYDEKYKSFNRDKLEAKARCEQIRNDINLQISQIMDMVRIPYYASPELCQRMYDFGNSMTKLKLPKTISKDFFRELAEAPTCICGHSIGEKERDTILKNADLYLGSDQQSVLNNIKSNLMNSTYDSRLSDAFDTLTQLIADQKIAQDNLLVAEEKLTKAGGEEAIRMRDQRDQLIADISHKETEISIIVSKDENDPSLTEESNLNKARTVYADLESKIASATRTNEALRRKELIDSLIQDIKRTATRRLKQEIIRKTNEKLKKVIVDDIIEIESIDRFIRLKGKMGASEGQTLSIAYCFLGTMFEDSELQFPFVIDSPAGKMDYEKRRAVASILPSLFNQLISFVTSAEVEQFADQFYEAADSQFLTIIATPNSSSIEIHSGKNYFDAYQREHREEEEYAL